MELNPDTLRAALERHGPPYKEQLDIVALGAEFGFEFRPEIEMLLRMAYEWGLAPLVKLSKSEIEEQLSGVPIGRMALSDQEAQEGARTRRIEPEPEETTSPEPVVYEAEAVSLAYQRTAHPSFPRNLPCGSARRTHA